MEQEKNELVEKLEQTESKIKELQGSLLTAGSKILQLEARIKELEQNNLNSSESRQASAGQLTKLRKELNVLKNNSQQEINQLKSQLQQAKIKEIQLTQKIQQFLTKKESKLTNENFADASC